MKSVEDFPSRPSHFEVKSSLVSRTTSRQCRRYQDSGVCAVFLGRTGLYYSFILLNWRTETLTQTALDKILLTRTPTRRQQGTGTRNEYRIRTSLSSRCPISWIIPNIL